MLKMITFVLILMNREGGGSKRGATLVRGSSTSLVRIFSSFKLRNCFSDVLSFGQYLVNNFAFLVIFGNIW